MILEDKSTYNLNPNTLISERIERGFIALNKEIHLYCVSTSLISILFKILYDNII